MKTEDLRMVLLAVWVALAIGGGVGVGIGVGALIRDEPPTVVQAPAEPTEESVLYVHEADSDPDFGPELADTPTIFFYDGKKLVMEVFCDRWDGQDQILVRYQKDHKSRTITVPLQHEGLCPFAF